MKLIDRTTWQPQNAQAFADELMNGINAILQENNIRDDNNNLVSLTPSFSNAFYLLALAAAEKLAENDSHLQLGLNSFNVALCDDQQVENLLPITGIERNAGSYSTLKLTVTAGASGACVVPAGTRAPFEDFFFVVKETVTIPAGTSAEVQTACDTVGPVVVLSGEVQAFEVSLANLDNVINNESSVPGTAPETVAQLRRRIAVGATIDSGIDGLKYALEALPGIAYARVYFNYNTSANLTLPGGVVVPPRKAYIVVYGDSVESAPVADTYAAYMDSETINAPGAVETALSQNYVTASGQVIPVYYDRASEQNIYVKIYLEADAETGSSVESQLRSDLIASSADWEIGGALTSTQLNAPFIDCTYTDIAYIKVSDDGTTWSDYLVVGSNKVPRILDANITVEVAA